MIELKNISKSFDVKGEKSRVIDSINLRVYEEEIFGLVGATGSGKSTILRLMNGFIQPDGFT